jgi:hypothetical protein
MSSMRNIYKLLLVLILLLVVLLVLGALLSTLVGAPPWAGAVMPVRMGGE